jgi:hypothetical protein
MGLFLIPASNTYAQTKYIDSTKGSIYVASVGYVSGPGRNSQSGFSVGTGGRFAEIGITYIRSTIFYGEFNDQQTHGRGFAVYIEFFAKRLSGTPLTAAIAASYLGINGNDINIPFKHVILAPTISYVTPLSKNIDLIPEVGFSQMIVFEGGKAPEPTAAGRITAMYGSDHAKLFVTGEVGQADAKSFGAIYCGIIVK